MAGYGQYCAVARAHEALGGRWTLLVVRELLSGARRFTEIRRGIPRISRTMLTERLDALMHLGVVRHEGADYLLTPAGEELAGLVFALASWGQRWLPRNAAEEDIDLDPLLLDMQRQARLATLPAEPLVVRIELRGRPRRFLRLQRGDAAACDHNPGFPEPLRLSGPFPALVAWWRGDTEFAAARRMGLTLEGRRELVRAFPEWFARYRFVSVRPAA